MLPCILYLRHCRCRAGSASRQQYAGGRSGWQGRCARSGATMSVRVEWQWGLLRPSATHWRAFALDCCAPPSPLQHLFTLIILQSSSTQCPDTLTCNESSPISEKLTSMFNSSFSPNHNINDYMDSHTRNFMYCPRQLIHMRPAACCPLAPAL